MGKEYVDDINYINGKKLDEILDTLPYYVKTYFRTIKSSKSSRTLLEYGRDLQRFFNYLQELEVFRDKDIKTLAASETLGKLEREDFLDYYDSLRYFSNKSGQHLSKPETLARKSSSLKSFFSFLFKDNFIDRNLSEVLPSVEVKRHNIVTLDTDEISRLSQAITDTTGMNENELQKHNLVEKRDLSIVALLLGTGIRVSELVGINLKDIDFKNARISVIRKGGNADEVYFGDDVEARLLDYINEGRGPLLHKLSDSEKEKQDALFVSWSGKRLAVRSIQDLIKKYGQKAGISAEKHLSPHKFRKTFGTIVLEETGDIAAVADALGHSSIETTKRHYARTAESAKRKVAKVAPKL